MKEPLRLLLIEDSQADAELVVIELRRGGYEPYWHRIESGAELKAALDEEEWDIVITDYVLPSFSAPAALRVIRERGLPLPCIVISGKRGEETAVEVMKAGAHDYLVKDKLARLAPAVRRELEESRRQQETEAALKESERRFRETLEKVHLAAVCLDTGGIVTFCNEFLAKLTGWGKDEIVGKEWFVLFTPDEEGERRKFRNAMSEGCFPDRYENEIVTRGGKSLLVSWNITLLHDRWGRPAGITSLGEDITDRARKERELRSLKTAVETMQMGVTITDMAGRIIFSNPADASMHGYTPEELIGQDAQIFAPHTIWRKMSVEEIVGLKSRQRESINIRKDGSTFVVHLRSDVVEDAEGTPSAVVTTCFDITGQKEMERQLRHMSTHDPLTGLFNRAFFEEELERLRKGNRFPVIVLIADVDGLKIVNDRRGHGAGDEHLKMAAGVLRGAFRADDVVARIGGDEFVVLLTEVEEREVEHAVERIRRTMAELCIPGDEGTFGLSLGVAVARKGDELATAIRQADALMYQDKQGRRKKVQGMSE